MVDYLANPWLQRLAFVLGGLLSGLLVDRWVVGRARRLAAKTQFQWDDLIAESLSGVPTVWLGAGGVYLALNVEGADPLFASTVMTVLTVLLMGSIIIAAMRIVGGAVEMVSGKTPDAIKSPTLVVNLARMGVGALGIIIILQNLGIDITPLVTALGIGGLAVALALQDTLGNLFAGVQIILSKQVRPRDYIRLASGEEGWVTDVKGRHTTIQTFPDGNLVVVPNSVLASSIVKNFSMPRKALWVSVDVGVSYDSDLEHVEEVTLTVARELLAEAEGGVPTTEPLVRFHTFADSSVNFEVRMLVRAFREQGPVRHEFIKRLHRRFGEEGIEIPFPIRTVVMKTDRAASP
jgi:small-conductance mechanosensitive channel